MNENHKRIEEFIKENGSCMLQTSGASMRPLFRGKGDAALLVRPDRDIGKYDVVLYRNESAGKYVLHRVIKVNGDVLVIRGDNTFVKEYVPRADVIAYMTAFNRKGKRREVTDFSYVLYSRFWNFIYPLRFVLRKIRTLLGRIKRKVFN